MAIYQLIMNDVMLLVCCIGWLVTSICLFFLTVMYRSDKPQWRKNRFISPAADKEYLFVKGASGNLMALTREAVEEGERRALRQDF